jgi:hypothetical protein
MTLTSLIVSWAVLALIVAALLVRRIYLGGRERDALHLEADPRGMQEQVAMSHRINEVDRWGQALTVIVLVSGIVLAVVYAYSALQ